MGFSAQGSSHKLHFIKHTDHLSRSKISTQSITV
ncbi:hypothetical protein VCSRO160_3292 [Vibrio cholerae]|nr:hypothetical protein VCSRO160_3292 [Vibrio cholerae]